MARYVIVSVGGKPQGLKNNGLTPLQTFQLDELTHVFFIEADGDKTERDPCKRDVGIRHAYMKALRTQFVSLQPVHEWQKTLLKERRKPTK